MEALYLELRAGHPDSKVWNCLEYYENYYITRSLGPFRGPTPSWRPLGFLDFVLRALRPVRRASLRSSPQFLGFFSKSS